MEGGKYGYTPLLYCKVLFKTSCKVIAIVPLEYVIVAGISPWRDVALLEEDPCIGAFPLFEEEAIFHTLVGLSLFSCQNMFE